MYKNLDGEAFGVSGRQNEVIELALSYSFDGINVDVSDMLTRAKASGQGFATRYLDSTEIKVGEFKLPIKVSGPEPQFDAALTRLRECCEIAKAIGAQTCRYELEPASDSLTYQDNFDLHRERLTKVAGILAEFDIRLGITFNAIAKKRKDKDAFIHEAEPTLALIKTIGQPNVGLALDIWHWQLGGGTIEQLNGLKAEQVVTVRLADMTAGTDPAEAGSEQRLLPGTTEDSKCLDVIKWLKAIGYEGPVTPGQSPVNFGRSPREAMVQQARDAMDRMLVEAGVIEPRMIPSAVVIPGDEVAGDEAAGDEAAAETEAIEADAVEADGDAKEESPVEDAVS